MLRNCISGFLFLFSFCVAAVTARQSEGFGLQVIQDEITILVNGVPWLEQKQPISRVVIHKDFTEYSNVEGTLLLDSVSPIVGQDDLGSFEGFDFWWNPADLNFGSSVRLYEGNKIIVFKQSFRTELWGTSVTGDAFDDVTTSFPSLNILTNETRGFVSYGGFMGGWEALSVGSFGSDAVTIRDGQFGGPLAIFDSEGSSAVMMSSLGQFMASNMKYRSQDGAHVVDFGLMGSMEIIPRDFELETILVWDSGIVEAHKTWGDALNRYYGKSNQANDVVTNYLGLWTDNGAFYYYNPVEGMNYEDTLLEMDRFFEERNLPVRYIDLDSWWYFKGDDLGVKNWTEMPSVFPNGLLPIYEATGRPFAAHNRYWATDNDYATVNGGQFEFFVEMDNHKALPKDIELWRHLFSTSLPWGLQVYEQDWQDRQFVQMNVTHTDVSAARNWFLDMGQAASEYGITLQYCMSLPRQVLQSVETPANIRIRTSGDYQISKDNWRIGMSNLLSVSLGLVPFKNTFWSAEENPGNTLYYECMDASNNTDPNVPWDLSYRYTGHVSQSKTGRECLRWSELELHVTLPFGDFERNECRNPKTPEFGNGLPFCFVEGSLDVPQEEWVWEECDIPLCGVDCEIVGSGGPQTGLPPCQPFREENPSLHAVVAALSRGGVGPGDKMDNLDLDLIMRTCREDGRLLHPSQSVIATQAQILKMAFGGSHNPSWPHSFHYGDVWHTRSTLSSNIANWTVDYLFMAESLDYGSLSPTQLGLANANGEVAWFKLNSDDVVVREAQDPLLIPDLGPDQFELWYFAPVWQLEGNVYLALLGERDKIVPVSTQRISSWTVENGDFLVNLEGAPNEEATLSFFTRVNSVESISDCNCRFGPLGGMVTIRLDANTMDFTCV